MALNKRDYQKQGQSFAKQEPTQYEIDTCAPFKRTDTSWQARAWWEGYDSHITDKGRAAVYDKIIDGKPVKDTHEQGEQHASFKSSMPSLQTIPKGTDTGRISSSTQQVLYGGRTAGKSVGFILQAMWGISKREPGALPAHWPEGAKAHASNLAAQYIVGHNATEPDHKRQGRLLRAINRLGDRHRAHSAITIIYQDELQ